MAYKEVVEMFGENFASLFSLAGKWFIEWKIDIKKLLHIFHQIKKSDLLGLISGSHEIRQREILKRADFKTIDGLYLTMEPKCFHSPYYVDTKLFAKKYKLDIDSIISGKLAEETVLGKRGLNYIRVYKMAKEIPLIDFARFIFDSNGSIPTIYDFTALVDNFPELANRWVVIHDENQNRTRSKICYFDNEKMEILSRWYTWGYEKELFPFVILIFKTQ